METPSQKSNNEKYNPDWFKDRAFHSLQKKTEGVWDYSDSLLIYVSSGAEIYESMQETDTPYFKLITKPEHQYLKSIAGQIAATVPENFDFVDFGPGTEHKEQFLFDEFKTQGKKFTYIPVDISDHFLDVAEKHASEQEIPTQRMKSSFEELSVRLGQPTKPRLVSLGLTFSNYQPQEILRLLKEIAGKDGIAFINAQMRDRIDMNKLQEVYQEDATKAFDEKIKLLGLDPEKMSPLGLRMMEFKVWCTVINTNRDLEKMGVATGDRLLVFQSLRYTKKSLEDELSNENHELFDTGSSFIASIIRT